MPRARKTRELEGEMYEDIRRYFTDAYKGKCVVYINPRRVLRKTKRQPDLLIVPTTEADELIAVEAKREAVAASFSQALGRSIEFREYAMQTYIAFNEPIPDRFRKDLETVAPKTGLLARTSDRRIVQLRRAKREAPRKLEMARELKHLLSNYQMYLLAEKRGRIEGRKYQQSLVNAFQDFIEQGKFSLVEAKDYWYEPGTNTVHVTVDDTLDDAEPIDDAVYSLDGDIQELNLKEKYGPNVRIDLGSDVFIMCECGHVMAGECLWCGRRQMAR